MTSSHQLLYRIAELMLQYEQHVLSVDLLFDDMQISDFVKSIQIDSPYQQMLLEGVLTESVRGEKLYVWFTVEGYFHFLLGEVIFNQTKSQSVETLNKILEGNLLKGVKEGVEQCLIRDVQKNNLNRLSWLINNGNSFLDIYSIPLASTFLMASSILNKEDELLNNQYLIRLENILNILLSNQTNNNLKVLQKAISHLKRAQKQNLVSDIHKIINERLTPDKLINASLYVKTIEYIPKDYRTQKLNYLIKTFLPDVENKELSNFYSMVSEQYRLNENHEMALVYLEKSWKNLSVINAKTKQSKIEYFNSLAKIYQSKKDYNNTINYFQRALSLSLLKYNEHSSAIAILNANIGFAYLLNKNYDEGIEYIEKSIKILSRVIGVNHINISRTYMMYATALISKKDFEKAIDIYQKSISIELKIFGPKSKYVAFLYTAVGIVWEMKNDYDKVIYNYNQSLIIYLKADQNCNIEIAELYNKLGFIYLNKRIEFDLAIQQFEKALDINLKINGKLHPSVSDSLNYIGLSWKRNFQYQKAIGYFKDSNSIILKINGNLDKKLLSNYQNIASCLSKIKEYRLAIQYYEKALSLVLHYYTENNKKAGDIYNYIGLNFQNIGDYESALVKIEKSLSIRIKLNGFVDKDVAICYNNLASISYKKNNFKKAEELFRVALEVKSKIYGDNHLELFKSYVYLGKTLIKLFDYPQALKYFKLGFEILPSDDLLFNIAECYVNLKQYDLAFNSFLESAEISKSKYGLENDSTKKYSKKCFDFARSHDMSDSLPQWINDIKYDL